MKIDLRNILPMESLMQFTYENINYDFHNFYHCYQVILENEKIFLLLRHLQKNENVKISFTEVSLEKLEFNLNSFSNGFTIDQMYRGRHERNNKLIEVSESGKIYLYINFVEDFSLEFWCESMTIEN